MATLAEVEIMTTRLMASVDALAAHPKLATLCKEAASMIIELKEESVRGNMTIAKQSAELKRCHEELVRLRHDLSREQAL